MKTKELILFLSFIYVLFSCNSETKTESNDEVVASDTLLVSTVDSAELLKNVPVYIDKVTDYANIFNEDQNKDLVDYCNKIEQETSRSVYILAVGNTGNDDMNDYAPKVARGWEMAEGLPTTNAVLIIMATETGKLKFHVGGRMNAMITDGDFQKIVDTHIAPNFPKNQYYEGLIGGLEEIHNILANYK